MIVDLPSTTTSSVSKKLVALREDVGSMALSRVLTLIVVVDDNGAESAITTAMAASRQHPCRILVVVTGNRRGAVRLDAQIRVGGDAGASEVVVLRLYGPLASQGRSVVTPLLLADSPIVAWWPGAAPADPGADPVGAIAQRRITDAARTPGKPRTVLGKFADAYLDGDTDLAWSRITLWRGLLAAALDQAPYEAVTRARVVAAPDSPSGDLLAGWLAVRLKVPVDLTRSANRSGIISVRLDGNVATLHQSGQPDRTIALPHRSDAECLADELRRLDPDEVYQDALTKGLPKVTASRQSAAQAERSGKAPSVKDSARTAARLRRKARTGASSAMVEAKPAAPAAAERAVVPKVGRKRPPAQAKPSA